MEAMDEGHYEQAIVDFGEALEADPHLAQAHYARGESFYLLGRYEPAIEAYSDAVTEGYEPAAQAYAARGNAHNAVGDFAASSQDFDEAYALAGDSIGDYDADWAKAYSRAVELQPESASAYFARGYASSGSPEQSQQAIADLSTALDLGHEPRAPAYYWRAWAHYTAGSYQPAAEDYSRVIELEPSWPDAYDGRGHAYIRLGQYDLGLADMATSIDIDP